MTLKFGLIEYINTYPLFGGILKGAVPFKAEIVKGTPSQLNLLLRTSYLDISLISSIEYLKNKERYNLIPNFGISGKKAVKSVLFYSKEEVRKVGLTHESASSIALLKILLKDYWKKDVTFEIMHNDRDYHQFDAFLLIGDKALLQPTFPDYQTFDLAASWFEHTQSAFPFALLVSQNTIAQDRIDEVVHCLKESLQWSKNNPEAIIDLAKEQVGLEPHEIKNYFHHLNHEFGEEEWKGLDLFAQKLASAHD